MAKVPFTKLKCKINDNEVPVQIGEETIAVKQYLPIQEKLSLIGRVVMFAHEQDYNYSNPVKIGVYRDLEIVFTYTNISFTDKQKEDLPKLYDMLYSSGVIKTIINNIPEDEYMEIVCGIEDSVEAIYQYQNSALGILDGIKNNYNEASFDVEKLQEAVKNISNTPLVKEIMPLFGLE
jgi:hypothetical protein